MKKQHSDIKQIMSYSTAKAQSLVRYFTGKSCKRGHIATRLVSTRKCSACSRIDDRNRYAINPAAQQERSLAYQRRKLPAPTRPCPPRCELCGLPPKKRRLHLDHDHKTGAFRGWLCATCNTSLGKFGDDIRGLQHAVHYLRRNTEAILPSDPAARKQIPLASGVLDYFPSALCEIAKVSYQGNEQHNPGQKLHWARGKSTDHADTLQRHFTERGTLDVDGTRHSAKLAWRALALLQTELEEAGAPRARGAQDHADSNANAGLRGVSATKITS